MPAPTPPHAPLKLDDESIATAGDLLDAQLWLLPAEYWCGPGSARHDNTTAATTTHNYKQRQQQQQERNHWRWPFSASLYWPPHALSSPAMDGRRVCAHIPLESPSTVSNCTTLSSHSTTAGQCRSAAARMQRWFLPCLLWRRLVTPVDKLLAADGLALLLTIVRLARQWWTPEVGIRAAQTNPRACLCHTPSAEAPPDRPPRRLRS